MGALRFKKNLLLRPRLIHKLVTRPHTKFITLFSILILKSILVLSLMLSAIFIAPQAYNSLVRLYTRDKVFHLTVNIGTDKEAVGTGFQFKLEDKTYFITNRHVCEGAYGAKIVAKGYSFKGERKILALSKTSDICLLESVSEAGFPLANKTNFGDRVIAAGHPSGFKLTITSGEIFDFKDVYLYTEITKEEPCNFNNNKILEERVTVYGQELSKKVCETIEKAFITTIEIQPGSSGSPMLSIFGKVEGIMFAVDSAYWGRAIPVQEIKRFIWEYLSRQNKV